jgi:hypothetical protein
MNLLRKYIRELLIEKKGKGLWANIHAKRKRGERPAKPGEKGYPKTLDIDEAEQESTIKYNANPALVGDQTTLPDGLQKAIIDKKDKSKK